MKSRLNRPQFWTAIVALGFYLVSRYLVLDAGVVDALSMSQATAQTIIGLSEFSRVAAQFLGGFCVVIFATPYLKAHDYDGMTRVCIYGLRIVGAFAFVIA